MKKNITNIVLGANMIVLMMVLISASYSDRHRYKFDKSAEEAHDVLVKNEHLLNPAQAQEYATDNNANYVFIDVRGSRSFDDAHIEGALNIPLPSILNEEYDAFFASDVKKILYCKNGVKASQVWLFLTQYGYKNLYVMQGGLNYWNEKIEQKNIFSEVSLDDEEPLYDLELLKNLKDGKPVEEVKAESGVLPLPAKRKRKSVQGGCS